MLNKKYLYNEKLISIKQDSILSTDISILPISYENLLKIGWIDTDYNPTEPLEEFLKYLDTFVPSTWERGCKFFDILDYGISFYNKFYDDGEN